jgi:hypothetical protein
MHGAAPACPSPPARWWALECHEFRSAAPARRVKIRTGFWFNEARLHAPRRSRRADAAQDGVIQRLPFFEGLVQSHFAELAAHGGLRQLRHRVNRVIDLVTAKCYKNAVWE